MGRKINHGKGFKMAPVEYISREVLEEMIEDFREDLKAAKRYDNRKKRELEKEKVINKLLNENKEKDAFILKYIELEHYVKVNKKLQMCPFCHAKLNNISIQVKNKKNKVINCPAMFCGLCERIFCRTIYGEVILKEYRNDKMVWNVLYFIES